LYDLEVAYRVKYQGSAQTPLVPTMTVEQVRVDEKGC
jgi:hypothetical protein